MASTEKNVAFDVEGTLVGYEVLWDAIETRLGARFRDHGVKPGFFGYAWIECAEREYTYLSISGRYVSYKDVTTSVFWRVLWKAGIAKPRTFASEDDLAFIMDAYTHLEMRPGAAECIQKLRDAGFTVWGFTMSDLTRVSGYFRQAGIHMPAEHLQSCDSTGVGKPNPEAYKPLLKKLSTMGRTPWFAAAHAWDTSAAKRAGFKGAYCTIFENDPLPELFGEMDVLSSTLPDMADKIIAVDA